MMGSNVSVDLDGKKMSTMLKLSVNTISSNVRKKPGYQQNLRFLVFKSLFRYKGGSYV